MDCAPANSMRPRDRGCVPRGGEFSDGFTGPAISALRCSNRLPRIGLRARKNSPRNLISGRKQLSLHKIGLALARFEIRGQQRGID